MTEKERFEKEKNTQEKIKERNKKLDLIIDVLKSFKNYPFNLLLNQTETILEDFQKGLENLINTTNFKDIFDSNLQKFTNFNSSPPTSTYSSPPTSTLKSLQEEVLNNRSRLIRIEKLITTFYKKEENPCNCFDKEKEKKEKKEEFDTPSSNSDCGKEPPKKENTLN
jgi:hypothetical protein